MQPEFPVSRYASEFVRGLLDPRQPSPNVIVAGREKGADRRYNVYRNNVTMSLIDALVAIFPAVHRITGPDFFRAMARFHIRATPPKSPLLFEYGRDFPAFIEAYQYAMEMPWLADTARIERAWLDSYHAEDLVPMAATAFESIEAERIADQCFIAHPSTRIVRSRYSSVSIFAMNRANAPTGPLNASHPEDALITRPDGEVLVACLPTGGAAFLTSLMNGESLGAAAESALEESSEFDLFANLHCMFAAGAFARLL